MWTRQWPSLFSTYRNRTGDDDGHDQSVDGHRFTHDDGDEILGSDARGFDTAAQDAHASGEDSSREKMRVR